jgi:nucleoid-associated protein YgaU
VLATWYLLGATVLAVVAGLVRADPLTAAVQRVTPGVVRRLATGGGGVGLLVGGAVASLPVPDDSPPRTAIVAPAGPETEVATMTRAGPAGPSPGRAPGRATMTPVDAPPAAATMTRVDLAVGTPAAGPDPPATTTGWSSAPDPSPPAGEATSWVVEPGDSFWSIAEDVVGGERERAVGRYWRTLVEANRSRLVDPDNPDLLVPGQELTLPNPEPPDP